MNKTENKLYEKSEKAESLSIDLQEILHEIFYDPDGASAKDIEDMLEILGILKQATRLATRIEKRLHG